MNPGNIRSWTVTTGIKDYGRAGVVTVLAQTVEIQRKGEERQRREDKWGDNVKVLPHPVRWLKVNSCTH